MSQDDLNADSLGLIYKTNIQQKSVYKTVSTHNLELFNMDMRGGYDQISGHVSARLCKFELPELVCSIVNLVENYPIGKPLPSNAD